MPVKRTVTDFQTKEAVTVPVKRVLIGGNHGASKENSHWFSDKGCSHGASKEGSH